MVIGYNNPTQFFGDVYVKCIDPENPVDQRKCLVLAGWSMGRKDSVLQVMKSLVDLDFLGIHLKKGQV